MVHHKGRSCQPCPVPIVCITFWKDRVAVTVAGQPQRAFDLHTTQEQPAPLDKVVNVITDADVVIRSHPIQSIHGEADLLAFKMAARYITSRHWPNQASAGACGARHDGASATNPVSVHG